jgi:hypothetical protein
MHVYEEGSNAYSVGRSERWELKVEATCNHIEEAQNYVRDYSRQYTILPNFLQQWRETAAEDRKLTEAELIEEFCFTNPTYEKYRRLFINKPDTNNIKKMLQQEGIQVINIK